MASSGILSDVLTRHLSEIASQLGTMHQRIEHNNDTVAGARDGTAGAMVAAAAALDHGASAVLEQEAALQAVQLVTRELAVAAGVEEEELLELVTCELSGCTQCLLPALACGWSQEQKHKSGGCVVVCVCHSVSAFR
jgi:hypothetical protein